MSWNEEHVKVVRSMMRAQGAGHMRLCPFCEIPLTDDHLDGHGEILMRRLEKLLARLSESCEERQVTEEQT